VTKKIILIGVAAVLLVPGVANAAQKKGTVVRVDAKQHLIAVAQVRGAVALVHVKSVRGLKPGRVVVFNARHLRNGTFAGTNVRAFGRVSRFHVRGLVLKVKRANRTVVISARGAVLTIRLPKRPRATASASGGDSPTPGSITDATITVGADGSLEATAVKEVNPSASAGSIEGKVKSVGSGTITVADGGVSLTLNVPAGIDVSKYSVGSDVIAYFGREADGSLTLKAVGSDGDETEADDATEIEGDVEAAEQEEAAEETESEGGSSSGSSGTDSGSAGTGASGG